MSKIFTAPEIVSYNSIVVDSIAGANRVVVKQLLDILEHRAILLLRQCATPNLSEQTAQLHRGQFVEIQSLYIALHKYNNETTFDL